MICYVLAMGKQHLGPHVVVGYGIKIFWPGLFITSPDHLAYLCCAFMSWAGLASLDGLTPTKITLVDEASNEMKTEFIEKVIGKFAEEFAFVEFDIEKAWREQQEQRNKHNRQLPLVLLRLCLQT